MSMSCPQASSFTFTAAGKCSDVSGEIAASLAHAAIAFKQTKGVGTLATEYWRKAVMAYKQTGADTMTFGNSNDVFDLLRIYYPSSGVRSHVFFAAASMWMACTKLGTGVCTDAEVYKEHALELATMKEADGGQKWFWEVPGWTTHGGMAQSSWLKWALKAPTYSESPLSRSTLVSSPASGPMDSAQSGATS